MNFTRFLIMTLLFHASISMYAQTINFSGKNVPLKRIFSIIKKQTGTVFFYDEALIKEAKPVTVNLRNATLETALNEIFKDQPLTWALEDKTVTITKRPVSITTPAEIIPQSVQAKGTITDDYGNPISDVSVTVKGKQQGAISDNNGRFSIKADPKDILVFSSVSYATKEVKVESRELNIELQLEIKPMESLIVGGNFSASKRKADATAVTVLTSKTLEKIPVNTLDQIFRGWVPGTNSFDAGDDPGGFPTLTIRGAQGALSLDVVAVYVDGIEYAGGSGYLSQLDKTNIDRIEIVRGPGAATLYGTGSNGGIVQIFTKKGRAGESTVNFNTSAGFYKSKWVKKDPFQQMHTIETTTGFKNAVLKMGGSYRTVNAYLPDGGEKNKGFYGSINYTKGKWQTNLAARYNARNFHLSRDPSYDTATHPRTDIIIPQTSTPAYVWFRVMPTASINKDGVTETFVSRINLSHRTKENWINNLDAGYTFNNSREVPVLNGVTPLQRQYYAEAYNIITVRYSNVLNLHNSGKDYAASISSGAEYKKYASSGSYTRGTAAGTIIVDGAPDNKNYAAFVQANPSYKNVYLTLGLRYEKNELFTAAWNPRLGLTTNFDIRSITIKPKISWGKGITPPNYEQRFGRPPTFGTIGYANPDIKPQSQQGFDYGVEGYDKKGKYKFEAVYYDNRLKDMIGSKSLGPDPIDTTLAAYIYINVGEVANRGWEFSGEYQMGRFYLQGTFSIINSTISDSTGSTPLPQINLAPGTRLIFLPKHTAGFNVTYNFRKLFGKTDKGAVSLNVTEVDGLKSADRKNYYLDVAYGRTPYNSQQYWYPVESSAVFRVGVFAEYYIASNARFFIQGSNILNDYEYEFSTDYPTHGATWLFGFKFSFVTK